MANTEPGICDEHCHKLAQGWLHDLMPAAGTASRAAGKGRFILFAGLLDNYASLAGYGTGGESAHMVKNPRGEVTAKFLAVLTGEAGMQQRFRVTDDGGTEITKGLGVYGYTDGAARYLACAAEGKLGETLKVKMTLRGSGHVYDCIAGKYLGTETAQPVAMREMTGNLFALLPYKVEGVQVTAPASASLGQAIPLKAAVQTGPAVTPNAAMRHVIVAQLRRPDGKDLPVHRWIFETKDRNVEANLFLALNDPIGKWTLVVFDVATGVRQELPIEVQANTSAL